MLNDNIKNHTERLKAFVGPTEEETSSFDQKLRELKEFTRYVQKFTDEVYNPLLKAVQEQHDSFHGELYDAYEAGEISYAEYDAMTEQINTQPLVHIFNQHGGLGQTNYEVWALAKDWSSSTTRCGWNN